jgi:hypothetical protein
VTAANNATVNTGNVTFAKRPVAYDRTLGTPGYWVTPYSPTALLDWLNARIPKTVSRPRFAAAAS